MSRNTRRWLWIGIPVVIVLMLIFSVIGTYNSLAKSKQNVDAQWSQVENVMQRRYDLIPNLVNAVKGSMKQEQKVFGEIAEARKSYGNATTASDKLKADAKINSSVGTLINAIGENYPQLKSNDNVNSLMTQLEGSENRISVERRRYNESIQTYNNSIVTFPKNMVAGMLGYHKMDYYKADSKAQNAPKVDLDTGK
ncbi:LemA family protein [Xylocopilactobacillus apis]|uniref:LemA family protein n=1 Tax=Xylocopilactobacillus apis TaxID=2932183 RepID=A0AAU9DKN7_9LACO|nr:LemA family protein [Xylocopilactobacillus apis]BDR56059.1 LemA family protein [Xylocopilactobacillus apis]